MRAWRCWGKGEQNEKDRPEMPEQKEVDEAFDVCIEMLSKLSLPSNLDEAAERIVVSLVPTFGQKYEDGSYVKGIRDYFSRDEFIGLVKAGAEWMRGQGETYITHVEDASNDEERFPAIFIPVDSFKPGNKVVVQIRKKY